MGRARLTRNLSTSVLAPSVLEVTDPSQCICSRTHKHTANAAAIKTLVVPVVIGLSPPHLSPYSSFALPQSLLRCRRRLYFVTLLRTSSRIFESTGVRRRYSIPLGTSQTLCSGKNLSAS